MNLVGLGWYITVNSTFVTSVLNVINVHNLLQTVLNFEVKIGPWWVNL